MPSKPHSSRSTPVSSPASAADRHAVDVAVGVHHRARAALAHRHLERRQDHVAQLARPHRDRRVVAGRLRRGVAGEVLERRDDAARLEPAHVGGADRCRRGRGPRRASPRRGPSGSRARRPARATSPWWTPTARMLSPIARVIRSTSSGSKVAAHASAVGKTVAPKVVKPGQALLVRDRRDAEPRARRRGPAAARRACARPRPDRPGAVPSGRVRWPSPCGAGLLERRRVGEGLLHRRDVARAELRPEPDAAELGELLVERHLGQQRLHALGERLRGVRPGRAAVSAEGGAAACVSSLMARLLSPGRGATSRARAPRPRRGCARRRPRTPPRSVRCSTRIGVSGSRFAISVRRRGSRARRGRGGARRGAP